MERRIVVVMLKLVLRKQFEELGRTIGPELKGFEDQKAVKRFLLDCLHEAFHSVLEESKDKLESQQR